MSPRTLAALASTLPLLSACLLLPPEAAPAPSSARLLAAPAVCSVAAAANLQLPATEGARPRPGAPRDPLELAQVHTVNRPLTEIAVWQDFPDGWSRLSLQLGSRYAASLALRLREVRASPATQIWLCSAAGTLRQGPLTADAQAELWTAPVPGEQLRLEIWAPSAEHSLLQAQLTDVYAAYR